MLQVQHMRVGSLRCRIESEAAGPPELLADFYGAVLRPAAETDTPVDLVLRIREAPEPGGEPTDRLVVEPVPGGHRLRTDPVRCVLTKRGDHHQADVTVTDPAMRPDWLGYHLYVVFNRILLLLDRLILHAAAVRIDGRVDLFCGQSGAGKSTLAIALGQAGATILSEDYVIVRRGGGSFLVSGASPRLRVTEATEARLLPGRLPDVVPAGHGRRKKAFPADRFFAACPHRDELPDRIFLLEPGDEVSLRPARPRDALRFLLEGTRWSLRLAGESDHRAILDFVADLVAAVPVHHLRRSASLDDLDVLLGLLHPAGRRESA